MTNTIVLEVFGVLIAWVVAGYAIWKWGPGLRTRRVRCPEKGNSALVLAEQRESAFGCLRVVDLRSCSLSPIGVQNCAKKCMAQL